MLLLPVMVTWMSIEGHRRLYQVIPDPIQEWWDNWEIRGLILISIVSQFILTLLGDRTKYKPNILTRALLWSAYMIVDWVAAVAMGVISSSLGDYYNKGEHPNNVNPQLLAFWAPFFLIHLGGPDNITAYALEDNELWLRHLVGLFSQTILTVYVIMLSWKGNWLSHLTIPVLIIGIIKYGERTWSLYCGSIKHLRDSSLHSIYPPRKTGQRQKLDADDAIWGFFGAIYVFVSLFVDLVLGPSEISESIRMYEELYNEDIEEVSPLVFLKFQLKLMYNVFYTKAFANYGILGFISRLITPITTIVVFVIYANLSEKKDHLVVDHIITYLLMVGALIVEIYAFISFVLSPWTLSNILTSNNSCSSNIGEKIVYKYGRCLVSMIDAPIFLRQSDFFNLICNEKVNIGANLLQIKKFEELTSVRHCLTSKQLQAMIYQHLRHKSKEDNPSGFPEYRQLLLGKNVPIFASELEFHKTIITWHIATYLYYYSKEDQMSSRKNCKELSDYMFYLLVKQRHMLPVGAGLITLRDTVIQATQLFKSIKVVPREGTLAETCRKLLKEYDKGTLRDHEESESEMQSTSVLFNACGIANQLINAENPNKMWEFIEELWVEILSYGGAQCRVDMHAHQLRRDREFLSIVWLLQAGLGLLDQFKITPRRTSV